MKKSHVILLLLLASILPSTVSGELTAAPEGEDYKFQFSAETKELLKNSIEVELESYGTVNSSQKVVITSIAPLDDFVISKTAFAHVAFTHDYDTKIMDLNVSEYFSIEVDGKMVDPYENTGYLFQAVLPTEIVYTNGTTASMFDVYTEAMDADLGLKSNQQIIHESSGSSEDKLTFYQKSSGLGVDALRGIEKTDIRRGMVVASVAWYDDGSEEVFTYVDDEPVLAFSGHLYDKVEIKPIRMDLAISDAAGTKTMSLELEVIESLDHLEMPLSMLSPIAFGNPETVTASQFDFDFKSHFELRIDGRVVDSNEYAGYIMMMMIPTELLYHNGTVVPLYEVYGSDIDFDFPVGSKVSIESDMITFDADGVSKVYSGVGRAVSVDVKTEKGTTYSFEEMDEEPVMVYGEELNAFMDVKPIRLELSIASPTSSPTKQVLEITKQEERIKLVVPMSRFADVAFGNPETISATDYNIDFNNCFLVTLDGKVVDSNEYAGYILMAMIPTEIMFANGTQRPLTSEDLNGLRVSFPIDGSAAMGNGLVTFEGNGVSKTYSMSGLAVSVNVTSKEGKTYSFSEIREAVEIGYDVDVDYSASFVISSGQQLTIQGTDFGSTIAVEITGSDLGKLVFDGRVYGEILFFENRKNIDLFTSLSLGDYFTIRINGTTVNADDFAMLILQVFTPNMVIVDGERTPMVNYASDHTNLGLLGLGGDGETFEVDSGIKIKYERPALSLDQFDGDLDVRTLEASFDENGILLSKSIVLTDGSSLSWVSNEDPVSGITPPAALPFAFLPLMVTLVAVVVVRRRQS